MSTPARRKASTTVNEAIARPVRTGPQAVIAFAIVEFIDSFINDLTEKQYGAAVGLLVLILAGVQVLLENWSGKAFFRRVPPETVPVVENIEPEPESPGMEEHEEDVEGNVGDPVAPDHNLDPDTFDEEAEEEVR